MYIKKRYSGALEFQVSTIVSTSLKFTFDITASGIKSFARSSGRLLF